MYKEMKVSVAGRYRLLVASLCVFIKVIGTDAYITYIAVRVPLQGNNSGPGSPWPLPRSHAHDPHQLTLDPSHFTMATEVHGCDVIDHALVRYHGYILQPNATQASNLQTIETLWISVDNKTCGHFPQEGDDEAYQLKIHATKSTLVANTIWGVLRGLETFSQLVFVKDSEYRVNQTQIRDWPRFGYRGLLVDTARHYIRLPVLEKILDAMSYNKMNVFHWHIVDDQSFPYVSRRYPQLSAKGAYSPKHVYTQTDVSRIIEFARLRGIRVIPEFDTPGHTQSWGRAFPELLTPCWVNGEPYKSAYGLEGHAASENLDPTRNFTYLFMTNLLSEIREVFKDDYIDLGMDEAHYYCWQSSPNISDFLKSHGYGQNEYNVLERLYASRLIDMARSLGAKVYMYQDPIEHGALNESFSDVVIRLWKSEPSWQSSAFNVTKLGFKVIITACYYLNYISYGEDWRKFYNCDPQNFTGSPEQLKLVIGGETSIWDEYVDNTNILSRLWPRASSVAERFWSAKDVTDADSAAYRLDEQRCRMLRRGIPAEPILPGHCDDLDLSFLGPIPDKPPPCETSTSGGVLRLSVSVLIIFCFFLTLISGNFLLF